MRKANTNSSDTSLCTFILGLICNLLEVFSRARADAEKSNQQIEFRCVCFLSNYFHSCKFIFNISLFWIKKHKHLKWSKTIIFFLWGWPGRQHIMCYGHSPCRPVENGSSWGKNSDIIKLFGFLLTNVPSITEKKFGPITFGENFLLHF